MHFLTLQICQSNKSPGGYNVVILMTLLIYCWHIHNHIQFLQLRVVHCSSKITSFNNNNCMYYFFVAGMV